MSVLRVGVALLDLSAATLRRVYANLHGNVLRLSVLGGKLIGVFGAAGFQGVQGFIRALQQNHKPQIPKLLNYTLKPLRVNPIGL